MVKENEQTGEYYDIDNGDIFNSWGDHEKVIPLSDALKGARERYEIAIKTLTYLGFETGDISMIWSPGPGTFIYTIYSKYTRKTDSFNILLISVLVIFISYSCFVSCVIRHNSSNRAFRASILLS